MKRIMLLAIMVCALVISAGPASAVSLSLVPAGQEIALGGIASVDLVVDGLVDSSGNFLGLGAFDLEISYDPAILAIPDTDVAFTGFLGWPSDADAIVDTSTFSGIVWLLEVSFIGSGLPTPEEAAAALLTYQNDPTLWTAPFTLATLNFTGINYGFSSLGLQNVVLTDAYGFSYGSVATTGAGVSVPEPATLLLLGPGLVGLAGLRRRFKRD